MDSIEKGNIMKGKKTDSDLCMNCSNFDECKYAMNLTQPVVFCEEYACTDSSELKNNMNGIIGMSDSPKGKKYIGICNDCENLEMCGLQKVDSTVTDCEEYR